MLNYQRVWSPEWPFGIQGLIPHDLLIQKYPKSARSGCQWPWRVAKPLVMRGSGSFTDCIECIERFECVCACFQCSDRQDFGQKAVEIQGPPGAPASLKSWNLGIPSRHGFSRQSSCSMTTGWELVAPWKRKPPFVGQFLWWLSVYHGLSLFFYAIDVGIYLPKYICILSDGMISWYLTYRGDTWNIYDIYGRKLGQLWDPALWLKSPIISSRKNQELQPLSSELVSNATRVTALSLGRGRTAPKAASWCTAKYSVNCLGFLAWVKLEGFFWGYFCWWVSEVQPRF